MEDMMFKLSQFIDKSKLSKDCFFETIDNANTTRSKNILSYAMNPEYIKISNENPNVIAVITTKELKDSSLKCTIIDEEPVMLFGEILNKFISDGLIFPKMKYKKSKTAKINKTAFISPKTFIGENVIIGKNVIINDYTIIEDNCIIGDNVVLGCEGFYFRRKRNGELMKFLHSGGVHLHKNVEIMTNSMVQRAHEPEFTTIGEGTKISVNVNIGHSCKIGKNNIITGKVQIAGWSTIGNNCWIGTSAIIADYINIEDNASIKIGSVVVKDVKEGEEVSGNFAYNHTKRIRNFVKEQR